MPSSNLRGLRDDRGDHHASHESDARPARRRLDSLLTVLLFSLFGFVRVWRRGPSPFKAPTLGVALVLLIVGKWFTWWGAHTWGPRLLADVTLIFCCLLSDQLLLQLAVEASRPSWAS